MSTPSFGELIDRNLLAIPVYTCVQEVRNKAQNEEMIVVLDADGIPYGLLTAAMLASLPDTTLLLADYEEKLLMPTLTRSNIPLGIILHGMLTDPAIRWHVIIDGSQVIGVIVPDPLFKIFVQLQAEQKKTGSLSDKWLKILGAAIDGSVGSLQIPSEIIAAIGTILGGLLSSKGLAGDAILQPAAICYHCPGDGTPHQVRREEVKRSIAGLPQCPVHSGTRVIPLNPCGVI